MGLNGVVHVNCPHKQSFQNMPRTSFLDCAVGMDQHLRPLGLGTTVVAASEHQPFIFGIVVNSWFHTHVSKVNIPPHGFAQKSDLSPMCVEVSMETYSILLNFKSLNDSPSQSNRHPNVWTRPSTCQPPKALTCEAVPKPGGTWTTCWGNGKQGPIISR